MKKEIIFNRAFNKIKAGDKREFKEFLADRFVSSGIASYQTTEINDYSDRQLTSDNVQSKEVKTRKKRQPKDEQHGEE